jgi:hypothetical protein
MPDAGTCSTYHKLLGSIVEGVRDQQNFADRHTRSCEWQRLLRRLIAFNAFKNNL